MNPAGGVTATKGWRDTPFYWLRARAFCHATESLQRVETALGTVGGGSAEVLHTSGVHGNRLLVLEVELTAEEVRNLFRGMDPYSVERLAQEADDRTDDHCVFHFRLDKQDALSGRLALTTGEDAIALFGKVRAFPSKPSVASGIVRSYLTTELFLKPAYRPGLSP